ncbi:MAG: RNA-binding S4 domain-containing protein [Amaricoccus sp.]|uniref:RNA-binding S4 domain-containing protein n=1 Tax=Amaricoccus sp. TaxID=1872485 RepID=UPI0033153523
MSDPGSSIRLDKWLWQARFCKSRTIAAALIADGAIRVNSARVTKPATTIKAGDGLSFFHGGRVRVIRVLALGERRGPAPEARLLYFELEDTAATRDA